MCNRTSKERNYFQLNELGSGGRFRAELRVGRCSCSFISNNFPFLGMNAGFHF